MIKNFYVGMSGSEFISFFNHNLEELKNGLGFSICKKDRPVGYTTLSSYDKFKIINHNPKYYKDLKIKDIPNGISILKKTQNEWQSGEFSADYELINYTGIKKIEFDLKIEKHSGGSGSDFRYYFVGRFLNANNTRLDKGFSYSRLHESSDTIEDGFDWKHITIDMSSYDRLVGLSHYVYFDNEGAYTISIKNISFEYEDNEEIKQAI